MSSITLWGKYHIDMRIKLVKDKTNRLRRITNLEKLYPRELKILKKGLWFKGKLIPFNEIQLVKCYFEHYTILIKEKSSIDVLHIYFTTHESLFNSFLDTLKEYLVADVIEENGEDIQPLSKRKISRIAFVLIFLEMSLMLAIGINSFHEQLKIVLVPVTLISILLGVAILGYFSIYDYNELKIVPEAHTCDICKKYTSINDHDCSPHLESNVSENEEEKKVNVVF